MCIRDSIILLQAQAIKINKRARVPTAPLQFMIIPLRCIKTKHRSQMALRGTRSTALRNYLDYTATGEEKINEMQYCDHTPNIHVSDIVS